jgi:hypothetical protein
VIDPAYAALIAAGGTFFSGAGMFYAAIQTRASRKESVATRQEAVATRVEAVATREKAVETGQAIAAVKTLVNGNSEKQDRLIESLQAEVVRLNAHNAIVEKHLSGVLTMRRDRRAGDPPVSSSS